MYHNQTEKYYHKRVNSLESVIGRNKILLGEIANLFPEQARVIISSFPLFPLCMIGGAIVQYIAEKNNFSELICKNQILNIQNLALDYLIIAAISSISIDIVVLNWIPLTLLIIGGILWNLFCVMFLARLVFNDAWFERAIAEMGQSMGVTATGLLLLRTVDPDSKTAATSAFASKQLLHEPFMGGGLWTGLAIPLLAIWGGWYVLAISLSIMSIWFIFIALTKKQ